MATNQALIHYALDLEDPPVLACDTPAVGAIYSPTASEVTCPRCKATEHFPLGVLSPLRRDQERALIRAAGEPRITTRKVLLTAADLLSEEGENPEYVRAIVELTSALVGPALPHGRSLMTRILRALTEGN